ncbi:hypothetical protein [Novosphingobium soli]|uniref:Uncharacterized protein n=1 Tax=Novosphingobium soli TaxID=574956 RepID=A0ABV6CZR7_9SPHN
MGETVVSQTDMLDDAQARDARGPLGGPGEVLPFKPIGKGLPLLVYLERIYTGKYPKQGPFRGTDVGVMSGVKDYAVLQATARALNLMLDDVEPRSHITGSAFDEGTPVVLYSPAVMADSLILSIEIAVNRFDRELFDGVARALKAAGGMPLMMPYAGALLAAGEVVNIGSKLADALIDGDPVFSITEALNFGLPGRPLAVADHWLLTHADLAGHRYDPARGLVGPDGKAYAGDEPYVVLTLDGTERPELNGFAARAASAAQLERFYGSAGKNGGAASVDALVEGLQLVSDMRLKGEADRLEAQIAAVPDAATKQKLEEKRQAIVKNIATEILRPAS